MHVHSGAIQRDGWRDVVRHVERAVARALHNRNRKVARPHRRSAPIKRPPLARVRRRAKLKRVLSRVVRKRKLLWVEVSDRRERRAVDTRSRSTRAVLWINRPLELPLSVIKVGLCDEQPRAAARRVNQRRAPRCGRRLLAATPERCKWACCERSISSSGVAVDLVPCAFSRRSREQSRRDQSVSHRV